MPKNPYGGPGERALAMAWQEGYESHAQAAQAERSVEPQASKELREMDRLAAGGRPMAELIRKLTGPQIDELRRLARQRQVTYGRDRTRVQNILVAQGLAKFVDIVNDYCEITDAGREALVSAERAKRTRMAKRKLRALFHPE